MHILPVYELKSIAASIAFHSVFSTGEHDRMLDITAHWHAHESLGSPIFVQVKAGFRERNLFKTVS
jgi:hypothetical protein